MGDELNKPGEGGKGSDKVDLSQYVPKEDHEKVAGQVKELESSKKDLEGKLEEAKLSLLDPEYVEFLETKKGKKVEKKVEKAISEISDEDIEHLSSKQLLSLSVERAKEAILTEVVPDIQDLLKKQGATISDIIAVLELQQVEERYDDFNDFRDDVKKILETSQTPLTIEQAYLQAKGSKAPAKKGEEGEEGKTPKGTEKPSGSLPKETTQPKEFETPQAAAEDAWEQVIGKGKDIL